jgi:nicotinate phosphoribosyltransferase
MTLATMGIDTYQLTTLVAHAREGRLGHKVGMAFFSRALPATRNYLVFCGLRAICDHASAMRFDQADLDALLSHPLLGPALRAEPAVLDALRALDGFDGDIDALPEGTLAFAGKAVRTDGRAATIAGTPLSIYIPYLQVKTDLVRAKLIETPWLGFINHMTMVASKAARIVDAAGGKSVLEFGARRTHPAAAVEASYAAHLAGCTATSNLAAYARYGIPATGTMDHFAVQASERDGVPLEESEASFFKAFQRSFPGAASLLVDTYDTERGIRLAVEATEGKLTGIRLDSNVNLASARRARQLLDELGAPHVKIFASDSLDEVKVRELAGAVDGFGVGERITCSPDAPTGVGAVAKLVVNGYGKVTMKLARGSGKATLPGELQVYRHDDHDLVALAHESPPSRGAPLLTAVWRGKNAVGPATSLAESRTYVRAQIEVLPAPLRRTEGEHQPRTLVASEALIALVERLTRSALE